MKRISLLLSVLLSGLAIWPLQAGDFAALCVDRTAIEHIYHAHRTGTKPPFEEAMPATLIEKLVRQDLHKAAVLKKTYGVEILRAQLAEEMRRIDATTRAPEILAEIKHTLGDDSARFARSMAWPIIVDRALRLRFDNDDELHAVQRREAGQARASLLASQSVKGMQEVTWQLMPRPEEEKSTPAVQPALQTQSVAKSGPYSVEATAQVAQMLGPQGGGRDRKFYFDDLDPELQNVLRAQLQKPGDMSAVIETPAGFLVILAKEKTAETLTVASLSIPKRSYEEWLAQQPKDRS